MDRRRRDARAKLRWLAERSLRAIDALDLALAAELLDAGVVFAEALREGELAAELVAHRGLVAHMDGRLAEAEARYEAALERLEDPGTRGLVRARLAFARYDRGALAAAEPELRELADEAPTPVLRARARGYLGNVLRARRKLDEAIACYDEAERALATTTPRYAAVFAMDRAIAWMLGGDLEEAAAALAALATRPEVAAAENLAELVRHYHRLARALLRAPPARIAERLGDPRVPTLTTLAELLELATRPASEVRARASALAATPIQNAHVRITLDLLEAHARGDLRGPAAEALVIDRAGGTFRVGAARAVALAPDGPPYRMLLALVDARLHSPGRWVEGAELARLAWPDERMLEHARRNRLHVAIAGLRKAGLRPALESRDGAYRISPRLRTLVIG